MTKLYTTLIKLRYRTLQLIHNTSDHYTMLYNSLIELNNKYHIYSDMLIASINPPATTCSLTVYSIVTPNLFNTYQYVTSSIPNILYF